MMATRPAREDLLHRLEQVLRFALEACDVVPAVTVKPDGRDRHIRQKFVAEAALLLYAAHGVPDLPVEARALLDRLADALAAPARDARMLALMQMRPSAAAELAVGHLCLSLVGRPDPWFDDQVRRTLGSSLSCLSERLPWKRLEAAWFAGKLAGADPLPTPAVADTTLALGLGAFFPSRDEMYAFTHALIYLADFGRRPVMLARDGQAVRHDAESALAQCLDDDDFDLAAELLMTWPFLDLPWTPAAELGFAVLTAVEEQVGFLPSLSVREDAMAALDGEGRRQFFYVEAYHTVFVMGLLCAALLARGYADGRVDSAVVPTVPAFARTVRDPVPHWQALHDRLPPAAQARHTPFALTVELKRALAAGDIAWFDTLLRTGHRLDGHPGVDQGRAILALLANGAAPLARREATA